MNKLSSKVHDEVFWDLAPIDVVFEVDKKIYVNRSQNNKCYFILIHFYTNLDCPDKFLANLIASIILVGSAIFSFAISNAVPWSTEVLMKGTPRFTEIDSSKPYTLIGICP